MSKFVIVLVYLNQSTTQYFFDMNICVVRPFIGKVNPFPICRQYYFKWNEYKIKLQDSWDTSNHVDDIYYVNRRYNIK